MALFKKKEVKDDFPGLPELPELPKLPELSKLSIEPPEIPSAKSPPKKERPLPSFPKSRFGDELSQETIKSSINEVSLKDLPSIPAPEMPESDEKESQYEIPARISRPSPMPNPKPIKEVMAIEMPEEPEQEEFTPSMPPSYSSSYAPSYQKSATYEPTFSSSLPDAPFSRPEPKRIEPVYIRIDKFNSAVGIFQEIKHKTFEIENLLREITSMKQKEDEELREWEREIETIKSRMEAIDKNIFSKLD